MDWKGEVSFRLATREDIPRMAHVFSKAFKVPYGDEVILIYEASLNVQPDGCYVALQGDDIVGTGCYFVYSDTLAWIGNVAVLPTHQGRGIGTSIMRMLLKDLRGRNIKTIRLDASEAGHPIYRKLGFMDEYRTVTYVLGMEEVSVSYPGKDVSAFKELNDEILKLDFIAFGADRRKVLATYLNHGGIILATKRGYCMLRAHHIGPLVAETPGDAEKLLSAAVSHGGREIIVPEANISAVKVVTDLSFKWKNYCTRMYLGRNPVEDVSLIYGIMNYAKG